MGRWDLEFEAWEALDRFRFSARDADAFRNATVILMTAVGRSTGAWPAC